MHDQLILRQANGSVTLEPDINARLDGVVTDFAASVRRREIAR